MHIQPKRVVEALYRLKYFLPPAILLVIVLGTAPSVHAYERELLFRNDYHMEHAGEYLTNVPNILSLSATDNNIYSIYSAVIPYNGNDYDLDIDPDPDNTVTISSDEMAIVKYTDRGKYLKHGIFPNNSILRTNLVATDSAIYAFFTIVRSPMFCGLYNVGCSEQFDVDPGPNEVIVPLTDNHGYLIIVTLDQELNYVRHDMLWDLSPPTTYAGVINDLKADADGNLYYSGSHVGVVDYDLGPGVSEVSCPTWACAVFAKYTPTLELEYVYSWQSEQQASVEHVHLQDDYVYLGIAINAAGSFTLDMDPTAGGTDQKEFFEHSSAIVKLHKNGDYVWSHILTSLDLVGQYPFIDDSWYSASTIDDEGNVYVCSYIESDAVNFAGQTFEATSTANNLGDLFIYRLNSDGSENWGKMFNPQQSSGWASCLSGGFYNPFEDTVTFGGSFLDTGLDGWMDSGTRADVHTFTINPDGSEYSFNHLYESQDSSPSYPALKFFPHRSADQFRLFATIGFSSAGAANNTIEGNLYGETFNDIVFNQHDFGYYFLGWRWYDPDQDVSPSPQLTKAVKKSPKASNPNIKDGWKHPLMAGPNFVGTHGFIPNINITSDPYRLASVYLDKDTHHDDLYIHHSDFGWRNILAFWNNPDEVTLPWTQGFNAVSEISKIEAKASFNGYPVYETDNPFIILLGYDKDKLGNIPTEQLKIARFNEVTKKWETIKGAYVYPDGKIATVTNKFGYFSVVYPRSWWGSR